MNSSDFTIYHKVQITRRRLLDILRANGVPIPPDDECKPSIWADAPSGACEECFREDEEEIQLLQIRWIESPTVEVEERKAAAEERKEKILSELSNNGEVHQMHRTRKALHPPARCAGDNRDRRWRLEADVDTCEYLYRTPVYLSIALRLGVGTPAWVTPTSGNVYRGVWLTEEEHDAVKQLAAEERRARKKGGE